MPDDGIKCESFTVISVYSLLVYNSKYYLKVYWDNCAFKIIGKKNWYNAFKDTMLLMLMIIRFFGFDKWII